MADNVTANAGSGGATFATDEDTANSRHFPGTKIMLGAENAFTAYWDGAVTQSGSWTITANAGTNLNTSALALESGGNLATVAGAVSGTEMQVDVVAALPAGTNAIGKLSANSGVDIGDVDVTTYPGPADAKFATLGQKAKAGSMPVTLASDEDTLTVSGTVTANAGTNLNTSALALETGGNLATVAGAVSGSEMQVDVVAALPAGTNNIGDVDVASIAAGTNLVGDVGLSGARTSGGTTLYKNIDVDETEDQIKASAGQVYWIHAINLTAAALFLKFYNATAASVTVGTTVPDLTFPVPGNADSDGAGFTLSIPNGIEFGTAITIAATTAVADNDSGAPGANALVVNLGYA